MITTRPKGGGWMKSEKKETYTTPELTKFGAVEKLTGPYL
jgi:hypothetical protein